MKRDPETGLPAYPEHEKLRELGDLPEELERFLTKSGYVLAKWGQDDNGNDRLREVMISPRQAAADHYDIDLKALEFEKREMLRAMSGPCS